MLVPHRDNRFFLARQPVPLHGWCRAGCHRQGVAPPERMTETTVASTTRGSLAPILATSNNIKQMFAFLPMFLLSSYYNNNQPSNSFRTEANAIDSITGVSCMRNTTHCRKQKRGGGGETSYCTPIFLRLSFFCAKIICTVT